MSRVIGCTLAVLLMASLVQAQQSACCGQTVEAQVIIAQPLPPAPFATQAITNNCECQAQKPKRRLIQRRRTTECQTCQPAPTPQPVVQNCGCQAAPATVAVAYQAPTPAPAVAQPCGCTQPATQTIQVAYAAPQQYIIPAPTPVQQVAFAQVAQPMQVVATPYQSLTPCQSATPCQSGCGQAITIAATPQPCTGCGSVTLSTPEAITLTAPATISPAPAFESSPVSPASFESTAPALPIESATEQPAAQPVAETTNADAI